MKTHEKEKLLDTKVRYVSGSRINIPTFKMSVCDDPDVLEDTKTCHMDKNSFSEVQVEENDEEELSEDENLLRCQTWKSRNSILSRYSEISFRNLRLDFQNIFVLIGFLIFFIIGLFLGASIVSFYLCKKGNFILRDSNETVTLSQQFDMVL